MSRMGTESEVAGCDISGLLAMCRPLRGSAFGAHTVPPLTQWATVFRP